MDEMERQVSAVVDLFDRAAQLWTVLEEDEQVQQWDQEEGKISATIQDLKQRQKTMTITEHLKGAQDMKKLQAELIAAHAEAGETGADGTSPRASSGYYRAIGGGKGSNMVQAQEECATMIQEEITVQAVEALTEKVRAGPNTRKGTCRQVPQSSRGCRGSVQSLGGSG
jgi:hypothetical protein